VPDRGAAQGDWREWREEGWPFEDALTAAIDAWDGKSKAMIAAVHEELAGADADYLPLLVDYVAEDALSDGATWLLKHALENGTRAKDLPDISAALVAAAHSTRWPTQLHMLQILPALDLSGQLRPAAQGLVFGALSSKRAMLRAWAYTGADQLAAQHADLRMRVMQILDRARSEETAASVQARLKHCRF
jgi:hypothetical protein